MKVEVVKTKPFQDQKPGTSGLRKKTKVFIQEHYVENFIQATFDAVGKETISSSSIVVGGDGRYYNDVMIAKIIKMAYANGVGRVIVGMNGLLSTPAVSNLIRRYDNGAPVGGFILTASHNPGGIDNDCGIKYNTSNGGPAPESLTSKIYLETTKIESFKICQDLSIPDLTQIGRTIINESFSVEVVDSTFEYVKLVREVFDFSLIRSLTQNPDFIFQFDAMYGIAGPYAKAIFGHELGIKSDQLHNCEPQPDFNGCHPDPNLTYAPELVKCMGLDCKGKKLSDKECKAPIPDLGAATDGDADRNMILGRNFFVTPSDSLAIIAANADKCIPFFQKEGGVKALARSMPTSSAVDLVARKLGKQVFQVPTGWKFFGNLMDSKEHFNGEDYNPLICGEESFGTGSNHVREKDGIWAVLCWLSILAYSAKQEQRIVSVEKIVQDHWQLYGRNYYCRYDYENVESAAAKQFFDYITDKIQNFKTETELRPGYILSSCDMFEYVDPVDKSVASNQGWRFMLRDGSRFVFRRSGTGSVGATIRLYLEKYEPDKSKIRMPTSEALKDMVEIALEYSSLEKLTGREAPTVIT